MGQTTLDMNEKLELAISTQDIDILYELMKEPWMLVRRAVARNKFTPVDILNLLAYDKVANVSYQAVNNPNCSVHRTISDEEHPCVCCNLRGDRMNCGTCRKLNNYIQKSQA